MSEKIDHSENPKSTNESYNIWQQKMSEVEPFNDTKQPGSHEKVIELSDRDATAKLYRILNAEHKQLLESSNAIDSYGGSLHSFEYGDKVGLPGDALAIQMDALIDAENKLNNPDEYGGTNATMSDVLDSDRYDKLIAWQTSKNERGESDPRTIELERQCDIADDLFFRFNKIKTGTDEGSSGSDVEAPKINRPYISREIRNAVAKRDSNEGMKKEEMPAGKTKEQIAAEQAKKAKNDAEFKARMEAYMAERRAREQKQREINEQIKAQRRATEDKRQQAIRAQREKVHAAYHQDVHDDLGEEQEMEM